MKSQGIQTGGTAGEMGARENPALTKRCKVKTKDLENKTSLQANFNPQAVCIPWLESWEEQKQPAHSQ